MEGAAADGHRRPDTDRSGGSALMQPVATTFFFYLLSGLALLGGVLVITRKNAVHSALALILTLLALAGLYLMLYAPFVAGGEIHLYASGLLGVVLFLVMLVSLW